MKALVDNNILQTSKRIAVCTNSKHKISEALVQNGFNVTTFNESKSFLRAVLKQKLQYDTVILRWGDRDTWRALEVLPRFTKLINLYSPLFRTGLDHEINKKFFQKFVGTTPSCSELGRCNIPWDNRAFIYDFDSLHD